jgi:hypothetical protein
MTPSHNKINEKITSLNHSSKYIFFFKKKMNEKIEIKKYKKVFKIFLFSKYWMINIMVYFKIFFGVFCTF